MQKDKDEQVAERIIAAALEKGKIAAEELETLPSRHPVKLAAAMAIKTRTTLGNGWIAGRLEMRSAGNVSLLSHKIRNGQLQLGKGWDKWIISVKNI